MQAIQFSRSFLTFRIDTEAKPPTTVSHKPPYSLNNARIQLDCYLQVLHKSTGEEQWFALGASCKTEQVGVEKDIWLAPNADFIPIFSDGRFLNIKTYKQSGMTVDFYGGGTQPDRQLGYCDDAFDAWKVDLDRVDAIELHDAEAIVAATLGGKSLNARTILETDDYQAVIEYPVKTMNANERHQVYQTDTGPVLYPNLDVEPTRLLESLELAFSAFNRPEWIEFICRVPTPLTDEISVFHYEKPVRWESNNSVLVF